MTEQNGQMKTVIFDLGRVLVDYEHQRTLEGLAAVSQASADELRTLTDGEFGNQLGRGEIGAEDLHRFFQEKAGTTADFDAYVAAYAAGIQRNENALGYAVELTQRQGVQVGIISNTNEAHAIWLHANLPELKRFAHVILSNEVGLIKPDERIYQKALTALNATPAQALFVDDLAENIEAALALGIAGIIHKDWAQTRPEIESWMTS